MSLHGVSALQKKSQSQEPEAGQVNDEAQHQVVPVESYLHS